MREWKKIHSKSHCVTAVSQIYVVWIYKRKPHIFCVFTVSIYLFTSVTVSWQLTLHCLCHLTLLIASSEEKKKFYPDDTRRSVVGNGECYKGSSVPSWPCRHDSGWERAMMSRIVTGLPALGSDSTTATERKKMSTYNKRVGTLLIWFVSCCCCCLLEMSLFHSLLSRCWRLSWNKQPWWEAGEATWGICQHGTCCLTTWPTTTTKSVTFYALKSQDWEAIWKTLCIVIHLSRRCCLTVRHKQCHMQMYYSPS